jgi:hypothetical protein
MSHRHMQYFANALSVCAKAEGRITQLTIAKDARLEER